MKFYDSANSAGIVDDVFFITQTDAVGYPLADIARNANRHYYKAVSDIIRVSKRTQYDDSNLTTLSEVTFTWVAGQSDYSWPSNALKLSAIEAMNDAGDWTRLQEIDMNDPVMAKTISDLEETDGMPKYYDIRGDSIFYYPAPSASAVTLTAGGKLHIVREFDALTAADTTQEPGFAEPYHRLLSIGASIDWFMVNDTSKVDKWLGQYEQLRAEMREFYSTKNQEVKTRLVPNHNQSQYI